MKSLYNISGILPAQCRTNPNDCGIAWSEHRRVKREDVITIEAPQLNGALTEYLKETMAACMRKLSNIRVDQAGQGADQTVATTFRTKPIDPSTIKVGDTVRLVGMKHRYEWASLKVWEDYKIAQVDDHDNDGMKARILSPCGRVWIFDEDLMLVEQA